MKKTILLMGLALAGTYQAAKAESKVYVFDELGIVGGVSDNGQYAAITDDEQYLAYIWRASNPEELYDITKEAEPGLPSAQRPVYTTAMDVSDDGIVVGSIGYADYHQSPAYYKDGEWNLLPLDPDALNLNEAVCITPDGSVIAGFQFIKLEAASGDGASRGQYIPCQWFLQEDGTYELKAYKDIKLPDHQGFYPMTQTPDGKVIGGQVYAGFGSTLNALLVEGKLVMFDEISTFKECVEYRGKYYTGIDENGKQTWTEDINDPNIVWFETELINGFYDGTRGEMSMMNGFFTNCDDNGNFYGARSYVTDVTEDHDGVVTNNAVIYNYLTDTWYNEEAVNFFSAGIGEELIFTGNGDVIEGNEVNEVKEAYGINSRYIINGISKISADAKTIAGVASDFNPAISEYQYYPFIIQVDGGTNAAPEIVGSPKKGLVIATPGRIEVLNAEDVAVYDLNGRLVGTDKVTEVTAGTYVVKADDECYKIVVK
ncbi:MAG: hypothetical protein K2I92_04060 [Muribaculaceae bacterium]|nr:hypothetical protein [Muribaculaceae bacterium]